MSNSNSSQLPPPHPPPHPPPAPRSTGMLQRTGASEGFYRRNWQQDEQQSQPPEELQHRRSFSAPVQPETMNDRAILDRGGANHNNIKVGSLRPPGELGLQPPPQTTTTTVSAHNSNNNKQQPTIIGDDEHELRVHPQTILDRQRLEAAIRRGHAVEDFMARQPQPPVSGPASLVASFCYHGTEILVGTTEQAVYCMCARTRLVFQTLELPAATTTWHDGSLSIQSLQTHAVTGQICVALSSGIVQTYHPVPTDPKEVCFGRFRWVPGPVINCAETFYDATDTAFFRGASSLGNDEDRRLDLSLTGDNKVLVAHRDQLAVFDGSTATSTATTFRTTQSAASPPPAELLWTTQLPGHVVTAKISGDGQSIAVVLNRERSDTEDEEDVKAAKDGVHTFERDTDDGSQVFTTVNDELDRPKRVQSLGILYKPGPFLVHSARVTRLSFRGYGHVTSNVREGQGNDLLLTYCASDCSARIYCQNKWNPLTEWITPSNTRVDWIKCISAFSLGDLESTKKPSKSARGPPANSRSNDGVDIHESVGKRMHFSSIANQPAPTNNAGAWVVEITFQDPYPALRLSRLAYLERGVDDLNPTLLESFSSFLPVNCVFRDRVLASDESGLSIEGVLPAWNPWLSESTELTTTETLAGSAMTFLGLSSGPAVGVTGGAYFGASSLGGTQSPPSEIRIASSHAVSGQIVVLEFPVMGDKALTSLELGSPIRSVLSLSHMNNCVIAPSRDRLSAVDKEGQKTRLQASMCYGSSRLVAEVMDDGRSVSIIWRKPGTMSFLPHNWLADDVDPLRAADLLENSASELRDESLMPVPLVLPPVHIPGDKSGVQKDESIRVILWWPDSKFGGSPLLVAVMATGTIVVFEIPPPWSSLETPMPTHELPPPRTMSFDMNGLTPSQSDDDGADDDDEISGREYELAITPDPEYGLGLRLESHANGMCAVVGSFKRRPSKGEFLPAEKCGLIRMGDELLSANDVVLEDKPFDDIVAAVREVGISSGLGNSIRMRFRRSLKYERQNSSTSMNPSPRLQGSTASESPPQKRRTMEQMFGVSPDDIGRKGTSGVSRGSAHRKGHHTPGATSGRTFSSPLQISVSSVAGVFVDAASASKDCAASDDPESTFVIVPYEPDDLHVTSDLGVRKSLLFWSEGNSIVVSLLSIAPDCDEEKAESHVLGKHCISGDLPSYREQCIWALQVVYSGHDCYVIAVCFQDGHVHVVTMSGSSQLDIYFQSYSGFRLTNPWLPGSVLRVYSTDLLATMQPDTDGAFKTICVWSASPRPGSLSDGANPTSDDHFATEYFSTDVSTDYGVDGNKLLDFCFLRSGYLDASPSLVTFTLNGVSMLSKGGGSSDWMPATQISYSAKSWLGVKTARSLPYVAEDSFVRFNDAPRDVFPHLITGLCSVFTSRDESTFLLSDWHPESLLAHICIDPRGVKNGLNNGARFLFLWLCSEGRNISEGHLEGSLPVAPFPIIDEPSNDELLIPTGTEGVMASLTASRKPESPETSMIRDLQSAVLEYISVNTNEQREGTRMSQIEHSADDKEETGFIMELPPVLRLMDVDDLLLLWALGEVTLDPPRLETLDRASQLFLFSSALFEKLTEVSKLKLKHRPITGSLPGRAMLVRTVKDFVAEGPDSISSAGALAALLSSNQVQLMQFSRSLDERMTWTFARERRIAFWERSDSALVRLSEEIGQSIFRETRDSMECAIFFIISRKIRTLRNLAATDQSETGATFFKFLNNYDFSSERGRRAAEKNAFSLLRKCRYRVAAAFFLLASPPFLKSALETIATKMHDIDLAFLVGRLMENPQLGVGAESLSLASNFGGVFGGGGGYAATGMSLQTSSESSVEAKFSDWKPNLGIETQILLIERILPTCVNDNMMTAVSLLWLGKKEEGAWFMSGSLDVNYAGLTSYGTVDDVAQHFFESFLKTSQYTGTTRLSHSPITKANALIDFTSSMLLLESLHASSRVRFAASLGVSRALSARGVELPSIRALVHYADPCYLEDKENITSSDETGIKPESVSFETISRCNGSTAMGATSCQHVSEPQSSIFDTFTATSSFQKANQQSSAADGMQSSIFDGFNGKNNSQKATPLEILPKNAAAGGMQSSIFDDFIVPSAPVQISKPITSQQGSTSDDIQSSVFDSFDVPPAAQKIKAQAFDPASSSSSGMHSSIFDNFDVQLPARKPAPLPTAEIQSSVFDNFDVPAERAPRFRQTEANDVPKEDPSTKEAYHDKSKVQVCLCIEKLRTPRLWLEWRKSFLLDAAARRLVREIASVVDQFHGDPAMAPVHVFYRSNDLLVSPGVSEVLQQPCDSERILGRIQQSVRELCIAGKIESLSLVKRAIHLLGPSHNHRILFSVVLYSATGRAYLAEDVVRLAANFLIQRCHCFAFAYDDLVQKRRTRAHVSSQFMRREAASLSWQLESCLWLQRGGGLSLSGAAVNEAIVAVRIGLLLASWNRNFECLEAMIQNEPDCMTDEEAGRQLWTSLKMVASSKFDLATKKTSSGGWEFLVDCKRSQATQLLKKRSTGCFIIRPHAEDHGVFTLSFKTNLVPALVQPEENGRESESHTPDTSGDELSEIESSTRPTRVTAKTVRQDDVVQHAIIRLSESGFRCGSFGPFASLITLLDTVSSSLPFNLRFDLPPRNRVIKGEGLQTSPNAVLLRKLSLRKAVALATNPPTPDEPVLDIGYENFGEGRHDAISNGDKASYSEQMTSFALFANLLVLCLVRRQLSSVATFEYEEHSRDSVGQILNRIEQGNALLGSDTAGDNSLSQFAVGSRILGPLLTWCRSIEVATLFELAPEPHRILNSAPCFEDSVTASSDNVTESADAIEVSPIHVERYSEGGDSVLRGMIQESGVEFSTLRLVDAGECTMLVLFSRNEALRWLVSSGIEDSEDKALDRLEKMEKDRVIEPVDLSLLPLKQKSVNPHEQVVRYRFVDPWEVEALSNREGETRSASLGRGRFVGFSLGQVALATEHVFRALGGVPLLELWGTAKGGIALTKALASVHPPWERAASGDLQLTDGKVTEPPAFVNSIRRCLYRNTLYRRLNLPQRFLALVQVELLDLKNLTTPGGALSLTAYALLRLKRAGSGGLTNKARTLDSAATAPIKLHKTSGPNAPASWGSVVRFRFPLPEDASVDGTSYDRDRETLFKGPPRVLQVSVYEKKLLADHSLGTADISTDGLGAGGQIEEWVPLRSEKRGITWFARIRLTLRFELMCIAPEGQVGKNSVPSVGLQRIYELSHSGGSAHEDIQHRSMSSPDLMSYFEGIVY